MTPPLPLYRHDDIVIQRPYAFDVDEHDWLWEGTTGNRLLGHNLRTAELQVRTLPEFEGHVAFSVFAWRGKLVIVLGSCPYYLLYESDTGRCVRRPIAGPNPIVWYGTKTPDDKLLLFERGNGRVLILDDPDPRCDARVVQCPFEGDLGMGTVASNGLVYVFMNDPSRLVRFELAGERFLDAPPLPWPEVGIAGRFEHAGTLYAADSAGGRFLPMDLRTHAWGDPIPHPDYGKVFGFIGAGVKFQGKGYFALSTYAARSVLNRATGGVVIPKGRDGGEPTVDGRPPRFMEKLLVFDPETRGFSYLEAPPQPDGVPLLCYTWADETRLAITGTVLPYDEGRQVNAHDRGAWLVMQSEPADRVPAFGPYDFGYDRAAHLRRYRRSYPRSHALYLPEPPHTPPILNPGGAATAYPPGRDAELARRAAATDAPRYWRDVAAKLYPADADNAAKVRHILAHVQHQIYYNPIQVPQAADPIAAHEAHEGRCGIAMAITLELCKAAGVEARPRSLNHHCVTEAFYDGGWRFADALFFGTDQPARDGRVLSVDEALADPFFADAYPQECFAYDPELLMSEDGYQVLGYVFGPWGSEPYYSYYLYGPKEHPPTLPTILPAQRAGAGKLRLQWSPAVKMGGGAVEYDLRVAADRGMKQMLWQTTTGDTAADFAVPEPNRMYFMEVRAVDSHREKNPRTWYPAARYNFVLVPAEQYGWYGVV